MVQPEAWKLSIVIIGNNNVFHIQKNDDMQFSMLLNNKLELELEVKNLENCKYLTILPYQTPEPCFSL